MVTLDIFLWVSRIIVAILLALGLPMLGLLWGIRSDVKFVSRVVKAIDDWLRQRGLNGLFGRSRQGKPSNPLSPEKVSRREELVRRGKLYGLTEEEAAELRALLEEEARDDFSRGVLGALAFAGLMFSLGAIIYALSKKK